MGARKQRRAYSRVCGASTAKRPAALGYAGTGSALLFPLTLPSPSKGRGNFLRVARTGEPVRPQRGPYTGRGARTDGLPGPCHFLCTQVAAATSVMETSTRIADSAFTSGVTADFSMPYTLIGSVVEPTPAVKKLMMKSSSESVKAIS